ncbi:MAG: hypothetical protein HYV33_04035 [Candidatus Kerfeldbacteria bacterium]|nr:hypothetical protein [Candidatus Kerfeldbacteria bacterium]
MKQNTIKSLYTSHQTVFRPQDLSLLWNIQKPAYLKTKIQRAITSGILLRLRRGLYALQENYNEFEAANKLVSPSYISLRTVLAKAGAVFQYDSAIYSIARTQKELAVHKQKFVYHKIRDDIFFQKAGLIVEDNVTLATPERALLDLLYLYPNASVDHLSVISKDICVELLPLYKNQALTKRLYYLYAE